MSTLISAQRASPTSPVTNTSAREERVVGREKRGIASAQRLDAALESRELRCQHAPCRILLRARDAAGNERTGGDGALDEIDDR
jgi:hypothetical protein